MEVDSRDWGRPSIVDYVPLFGALYRLYWWRVAAGGDGESWRPARRSELRRATVPLSVSTAAVLLAAGNGDSPAYAVIVVLSGLLLYRGTELLSTGGRI